MDVETAEDKAENSTTEQVKGQQQVYTVFTGLYSFL